MEELRISNKPIFTPSLGIQRYSFVCNLLKILSNEGKELLSISDMGCGECKLAKYLKRRCNFIYLMKCLDVNEDYVLNNKCAELEIIDQLLPRDNKLNIELYSGSVTKKDYRFKNVDVVICLELIEHLHKESLKSFVDNIFGYIRPRFVIISTPNFEYNKLLTCTIDFLDFKFRDLDHKFEFTRKEFESFCNDIVTKYKDYSFILDGVGRVKWDDHCITGFATQFAIFVKNTNHQSGVLHVDKEEESSYKHIKTYEYHDISKRINWLDF